MATSRHFESRPVSHSVYGTGSMVGTKLCTDAEWDELEEEQQLADEEEHAHNSDLFGTMAACIAKFGGMK